MTTQHIIFDLDGTLIDSKKEILKTYRTVFDQVPPAVAPDVDKLNYGLTINALLQGVYGDDIDKIANAKRLFSSIYDNSDYKETDLYDGALTSLTELKTQGHELYIATNKRYSPTLRILEAKNMKHLFSFIMANEMTPGITPTKRQMIAELKRLGGFADGYMVGDTGTDIQAGNEEGMVTVAVSYGYESMETLSLKNPNYVIDDIRNLCTFVTGKN